MCAKACGKKELAALEKLREVVGGGESWGQILLQTARKLPVGMAE